MQLSRLLEGVAVRWLRQGDAEIRSLTVDDREAKPGALYVARRGYYGDGHDRIDAALRAGASALLLSDPARAPQLGSVPVAVIAETPPFLGWLSARFYGGPTADLEVYGVTGTNGKTSVAYLLEHMLHALGDRPALMGTIEYRHGRATHPACNTTPDALFVQRFARRALDAGASSLVLEVSSHALELARTQGVLFDSVGFTNLSHEHLDFHETMEAYRRSKERLFTEYLSASLEAGKRPRAAACVDDPVGQSFLDGVPRGVPAVPVAACVAAQAGATTIERVQSLGASGARFRLRSAEGAWVGETPLVGEYNLANIALAAAMVARGDPGRWAVAVASMARFPGVAGRLEPVDLGTEREARVFVDYAHTPDALARALAELRRLQAGSVTVVIGCGGDRDRTKRAPMALEAQRGADRAILTSDNPRSEDPDAILDDMQAGVDAHGAPVERIVDRSRAIERAVTTSAGALVLVAGKGHERYQERAGVRHRLDDREEARRAAMGSRLGLRSHRTPLAYGWSGSRWQGILPSEDERMSAEELLAIRADALGSARATLAESCSVGMMQRLVEAVLDEARTRPGGLWTLWAMLAPERLAGATVQQREAMHFEAAVRLPSSAPLRDAAEALVSLAPADRGLVVVLPPNGPLPWPELRSALAPDLVISETSAGKQLPEGFAGARAPLVVKLQELGTFDPSRREELLGRCRERARERAAGAFEPRPIPVPDTLRL
jgi:UDP-N-acetylmuramoyl-L-alanyl-D-glutamate--2,6-diaminopimelate ligase